MKEYVSRGEALEDFHFVVNDAGIWIGGYHSAWQWNEERKEWTEVPQPPELQRYTKDVLDGLHFISALASRVVFVVRYEDGWFINSTNPAFTNQPQRWDTVHDPNGHPYPVRSKRFYVEQIVSTGPQAFIRTVDGRVLRLDESGIDDTWAPGICDALTVTTGGHALALIRDQGIFEFDAQWKPRLGYPADLKVGVFSFPRLVESNGAVALSAYDKLWVSTKNEPLRPIWPQ